MRTVRHHVHAAAASMLVLLAALMHASWNALIKNGRSPELDTALVVGVGALVA
ncbi:hypothetical protein HUU05_27755, partial [candidate division KSB1 bacterium]|nr:hypothetical protein [candidate division KSB1 bacterium]